MAASDSHDHEPEWASWSNEQLLNLPMSQLGVTLDGAFLSGETTTGTFSILRRLPAGLHYYCGLSQRYIYAEHVESDMLKIITFYEPDLEASR